MSIGYRIVEPQQVDPLMVDAKYREYAVVIFYWFIEELYKELGHALDNVNIEVIKVCYLGCYPALGLQHEGDDAHIDDLVSQTADRLLEQRPVSEFIKFVATSDIDWRAVTTQLMSNKE